MGPQQTDLSALSTRLTGVSGELCPLSFSMVNNVHVTQRIRALLHSTDDKKQKREVAEAARLGFCFEISVDKSRNPDCASITFRQNRWI